MSTEKEEKELASQKKDNSNVKERLRAQKLAKLGAQAGNSNVQITYDSRVAEMKIRKKQLRKSFVQCKTYIFAAIYCLSSTILASFRLWKPPTFIGNG